MSIAKMTRSDRREFFRASARWLALAGIGALAAATARRSARDGQTCVNRGICPACAAFQTCGLPQALSARRKA